MNTDKAYLFGLLVGGGNIKNKILEINLPYNSWGSVVKNPARAGQIGSDIFSKIKPLFKQLYDLDLSYQIGTTKWTIVTDAPSKTLSTDVKKLLGCDAGEVKKLAKLGALLPLLRNKALLVSFIGGLVDTIGSLSGSHRRFADEYQIISFEFSGKNFQLIKGVYQILVDIGCTPDQVLWNHPNFHSRSDRYYKSWKKGFKVRVSLDDYSANGSFVFRAKQESANKNLKKRKVVKTTENKGFSIQGKVCLHKGLNSDWLPLELRGKLFLHSVQMCKFFNMPLSQNALDLIKEIEKKYYEYVVPFTVLTKGSNDEVKKIISDETNLAKTIFSEESLTKEYIRDLLKSERKYLYGLKESDGFSRLLLLQGIAYLYCAETNTNIRGKRVLKSYTGILEEYCSNSLELELKIKKPSHGTVIWAESDNYAFIVGYYNSAFNMKLSSIKGSEITMREPLFDECIKL